MSAVVLALNCPRCGGSFGGAGQDVVFWCAACRLPFEVEGGRFAPRRGAVAQATAASSGTLIHLPVWAFRVHSTMTWGDPSKTERGRALPAIPWVYVAGFRVHNASYFADAGQLFTARQPALTPADAGVVIGCSRGMADAALFVEAHLLAVIDRHVDVTGLSLEVEVAEAVLWGIPYFDEGTMVRDGIIEEAIPAAVIEALPDIRMSRSHHGS